MENQKNRTLELIKLVAAYMVVFIHVLFAGETGTAVESVGRFAVPLFFLISGFYSYQIKPEKIKKRAKSILVLAIVATVCCTIFKVWQMYTTRGMQGIDAYFIRYTKPEVLFRLFFLNVTLSSGHLWYLFAILYVYIIFYFVTKFRVSDKAIFITSFSLLVAHLLLGEGLAILGITVKNYYIRNFFLMGIPCFGLGLFARKYKDKFRDIPNYLIYIAAFIGILESIISRFSFGRQEMYIGSLFILFALVCTFIKYSDAKIPSFVMALEGCSTYIYIFHNIIANIMKDLYPLFGLSMKRSLLLQNIHPILVCVVSTIVAYVIVRISAKIRKKQIV